MKTYQCEYSNGSREAKIKASSAQEAYEKFLLGGEVLDFPVRVSSGLLDSGEVFNDHTSGSPKQSGIPSAAVVDQHAAARQAQSSLSSTDMLLKELIAEQKETNQWLKFIRWTLVGVLITLVFLNIRVSG